MKKIFLLILLSLIVIPEKNFCEDNVNIKELVMKQIAEAKAKNSQFDAATVSDDNQPKQKSSKAGGSLFNYNSLSFKMIVLAGFSVVVLSFVAVRRRRLFYNKLSSAELKRNIKLVREEKFIKPIDPKLKMIRTALCLNTKHLNKTDKSLTAEAKKYNLAKTELVLAEKFAKQNARFNH